MHRDSGQLGGGVAFPCPFLKMVIYRGKGVDESEQNKIYALVGAQYLILFCIFDPAPAKIGIVSPDFDSLIRLIMF